MTNQSNNAKGGNGKSNMFLAVLRRIAKDRSFGLIIAVLILLLFAAWLTPQLLTPSAINGMLRNNAIFGIMSIGMLMVLVTRDRKSTRLNSSHNGQKRKSRVACYA